MECEIRLPKKFNSAQRNFQLDNDLSQRFRHFGFACHVLPYFDKVGAFDLAYCTFTKTFLRE